MSKSPDLPLLPSQKRIAGYRDALVPWYEVNSRDLPWRLSADPYRIWVSEIMLQQTRVDAVLGHYSRFLERFPSLEVLAAADEADVLEAWSGLGYYRRARSLHAGARAVLQQHGGRFPTEEKDVLALPGIGRYTAGAIRSIAFEIRAPIVDGNVIRVLSRVFGIDGDPTKSAVAKLFWAIAEEVVGAGTPSVVNQAQMELGALVCTPASPDCPNCPLRSRCAARRQGRVAELPVRPPKRDTVEVRCDALLVVHEGRVLFRQRASNEISPGLWDLPGAFRGVPDDRHTTIEDALSLVPFPANVDRELGSLRHAVTYRRIQVNVHMARAKTSDISDAIPAPDGFAWWTPEEALTKGLSSPARRALARFGAAALPGEAIPQP